MLQDTIHEAGYRLSPNHTRTKTLQTHAHHTRALVHVYPFTTTTTIYTQCSATPCATVIPFPSFILQIIPSEESWTAPWEAGCPLVGFGPLIFRSPLLCFYVYRRRWVCTGHHMAGFLVFDTNVDYPFPCTLYILFLFVFEFCCFSSTISIYPLSE
jgi:hypothetical protein